MTGWKIWGIAAVAALALAPAARAEDAKRESSATSSPSGSAADTHSASSTPSDARSSTSTTTTTSGDRDAKQASKHDNSDLIKKLHASNVTEIEAAKVAKDNAQSKQVKDFADRVEKDHKEMRDALGKLADNRKLKLDEKAELAPMKSHLDDMKKMKGAQMDSHFTQMMVSDHQKDLDDVKQALQTARDTGDHELAQVLENAQTKMTEHLRVAQDLASGKGEQQRMGRRPGERDTSTGTAPSSTEPSGSKHESSTPGSKY